MRPLCLLRSTVIPLLLLALVLPAFARADQEGEDSLPPRPYQSPMRGECADELERDPGWQAALERQFEAKFQQRWATRFANDRRHVIMAYGALWVLTAGFLALVWMRQRRLSGEIGRLEAELARAIADDAPPDIPERPDPPEDAAATADPDAPDDDARSDG